MQPSVFGKATTFFQILSVITVLVANITAVPESIVWSIIYTATFFTVLSTLTYTYDGIQQVK
ncbi:MAG: hypothetical protein Q9M89_00895 [Persephonella sp.]|nr:hypothetical protein [Persephonella sp.]